MEHASHRSPANRPPSHPPIRDPEALMPPLRHSLTLPLVPIQCTLGMSNLQPFSELPRGRRLYPLHRPASGASQHAASRVPVGPAPAQEFLRRNSSFRNGGPSSLRQARGARPRPRCAQLASSQIPKHAQPGPAAPQEFFRKNSYARKGPASNSLRQS